MLGDGTSGSRFTPVDVVGLGSGVAAVSAGNVRTCALTTVGGVKCWGRNEFGQLGHDRVEICFFMPCSTVPEDVVGLESGVTAIASGGEHSCALTTAGGVKCWGINFTAVVGDGTSGNVRRRPVDVCQDYEEVAEECLELMSDVAAIAAGAVHTCAITTAGGVKCWGANASGQLGDGSSGNVRATPVDVETLDSGVAAIAPGIFHTCALMTAGGVKCWGANFSGQLGNGSSGEGEFSPTPVDVVGLEGGVAAVDVGGLHTCALTTAGGVKCWGDNSLGQLGNGSSGEGEFSPTPVDVVGLEGGVAAIAPAVFHTCALMTAGGVKCWGDNFFGQLGEGRTCFSLFGCPTPQDVLGLGPKPTPTPTPAETTATPAKPTALPTEPLTAPATPTATPTAPVAAAIALPATGAGGGAHGVKLALWAVAALAGAGAAAAGYAVRRLRRPPERGKGGTAMS